MCNLNFGHHYFFQRTAAGSVRSARLWITLFTAASSLLPALPYIALALAVNPTEAKLDSLEGPAESLQKESI
jgi:hypothetical protein